MSGMQSISNRKFYIKKQEKMENSLTPDVNSVNSRDNLTQKAVAAYPVNKEP